MHLDCTGMSGLDFGLLVFELWVCLPGPSIPHHFFDGFWAKREHWGTQGLTSRNPLWPGIEPGLQRAVVPIEE